MSKMWGMGSALAAHETREWSLAISLATGKKPELESWGGVLSSTPSQAVHILTLP